MYSSSQVQPRVVRSLIFFLIRCLPFSVGLRCTTHLPSGLTRWILNPRSLSEKEPVYQSIVAVSRAKGDNDSSLLSNLMFRQHTETNDGRALQKNVSALGAPALPV